MMKQSPTIVFFGSGPVAAESLKLLCNDFTIEAVITKPNPAHHRSTAPVIELCKQNNLTYYEPMGKAELTELFQTVNLTSNVGIVIDYGIIIDQVVIDYFHYGIINSHFSLLPEWRGADPITFSLLSGQAETGVSLMSIVQKMDEGPLLAQQKLGIQHDDTSKTLTQKLIQLSHTMLAQHLPHYLNGSLNVCNQTGIPTYSRRLTKSDGIIDWSKPAAQPEREVRAYHEWPKSTATIGDHTLILRKCAVVNTSGTPGSYTATKKELVVFCGQNALAIEQVQPVNKKEMPIQAFLTGYTL